ncbi:DUF4192 family protein [Sediminivirga luteola]|nr:DUF4192 family protein [Sediminivirga luteola]MCI2264300.1 DUF4192 domain-containing protein [Sediminivirga luteola]
MSETTEPLVLTGGPLDIIGAVPHQLGLHPRDSLVVVCLSRTPQGRHRLGLTVRADFGTAAAGRLTAEAARALVRTVEAGGWGDAAVLCFYDEAFDQALTAAEGQSHPLRRRYRQAAALLQAAFQAEDRAVLAVFGVGARYCGALTGRAAGEVHPLDRIESGPLATRLVYEGSAPAADLAQACALPVVAVVDRERFSAAKEEWRGLRSEDRDRARAEAMLLWMPGAQRLFEAERLDSHEALLRSGAVDVDALAAVAVESWRPSMRDLICVCLASRRDLRSWHSTLRTMPQPRLVPHPTGRAVAAQLPGLGRTRPVAEEIGRGVRYLAFWAALEDSPDRARPLAMMAWLSWAAMHSSKAEHYAQRALEDQPRQKLGALILDLVRGGATPRWVGLQATGRA